MAINFDNALGIHQYTVGVRQKRAEILSTNLAQADTPGYKARDIDFQTALAQAQQGRNGAAMLARTNERHIAGMAHDGPELLYRNPTQPDTGDGNTVEVQEERAQFLQNALQYQASVQFLGGKFKSLVKSIKGE